MKLKPNLHSVCQDYPCYKIGNYSNAKVKTLLTFFQSQGNYAHEYASAETIRNITL